MIFPLFRYVTIVCVCVCVCERERERESERERERERTYPEVVTAEDRSTAMAINEALKDSDKVS